MQAEKRATEQFQHYNKIGGWSCAIQRNFDESVERDQHKEKTIC